MHVIISLSALLLYVGCQLYLLITMHQSVTYFMTALGHLWGLDSNSCKMPNIVKSHHHQIPHF